MLHLRLAMASIVLFYQPVGANASGRQESPVRLSADLDLSDAQQAQLAGQAVAGSGDAARQLANFHNFGRGDRTTKFIRKQFHRLPCPFQRTDQLLVKGTLAGWRHTVIQRCAND